VEDAPNLDEASDLTNLAWDLDAGTNSTVYLDGSNLSSGNGEDDMQLMIRKSYFDAIGATGDQYLYLYTKMGATSGFGANPNLEANGSFEEWAAVLGQAPPPPPEVPEPGTMALLGSGSSVSSTEVPPEALTERLIRTVEGGDWQNPPSIFISGRRRGVARWTGPPSVLASRLVALMKERHFTMIEGRPGRTTQSPKSSALLRPTELERPPSLKRCFRTKTVTRHGRIEDGTTALDFTPRRSTGKSRSI
jgi:hypothetical protein